MIDFRTTDISRRNFLKVCGTGTCMAGFVIPELSPILTRLVPGDIPTLTDAGGKILSLVEAKYYEKRPDQAVQCQICPRKCKVAKQERGYCGVKINYDGIYYTLVHSRVCSLNLDPIEKKPLYHFIPRSNALSLATAGCNMMCKYCQNWQISQVRPEQLRNKVITPRQIMNECRDRKITSVAFTYSEPVIFYEYMYDIARLGAQEGIKTVMISNGYIERKPMVELAQHLTAVKVDFKAFNEKFYRDICAGHLEPVLETLKTLKEMKIWFELVYLMIPSLNDDLQEIRAMCQWISSNLGPDVPLHFSRFYPQYQLQNIPPTPVSHLNKARQIAAEEGIKYVYLGNVPHSKAENTYCPNCSKLIIERHGYYVRQVNIEIRRTRGFCKFCSNPIPGVWS